MRATPSARGAGGQAARRTTPTRRSRRPPGRGPRAGGGPPPGAATAPVSSVSAWSRADLGLGQALLGRPVLLVEGRRSRGPGRPAGPPPPPPPPACRRSRRRRRRPAPTTSATTASTAVRTIERRGGAVIDLPGPAFPRSRADGRRRRADEPPSVPGGRGREPAVRPAGPACGRRPVRCRRRSSPRSAPSPARGRGGRCGVRAVEGVVVEAVGGDDPRHLEVEAVGVAWRRGSWWCRGRWPRPGRPGRGSTPGQPLELGQGVDLPGQVVEADGGPSGGGRARRPTPISNSPMSWSLVDPGAWRKAAPENPSGVMGSTPEPEGLGVERHAAGDVRGRRGRRG